MMKRMILHWTKLAQVSLIFALFCIILAAPAEAQRKRKGRKAVPHRPVPRTLHSYDYGIGLAMGAGVYSGIAGAYMLQNNRFIQAQIGIQILNAALGSSVDYVMEFPEFIDRTTVPYVGGGVIFVYGADYASLISDADGDFHFGFRTPIGVYTLLDEFPVQMFGEVIPGLLMASETAPVLGVNLGFRWFF